MTSNCTWKRITSLLLVFLMVLGMAPVNAFAAEGTACGCESDDPSWHAPFCEAYVAPEDPQCQCVEKCAEGAANEWCDVCYFDAAACAASGEEEAAVYATAPTYISKIAVAYGAKESTPKDILSNNGFTIINYDLNKGCGATTHYIYLGYKTTTDPSQAITGIFFRTGSNPPTSATFDGVTANLLGGSEETNPGENKAVDLNVDASGDYIYAYVTRNTGRAPLTEIVIDGNNSKSGYVTPNVNLNQGTKGSSIYLHYKQFSATVSATYHYLNASGSRTSSTQSGTVKTHLEQMSKVPSYPTTVTYEGRSYTFKGWREDNTANAASTTAPYATYMTGTKTYRAVYQGDATVSFNANGGSGAPAAVKGSHYINAGSSSVSKQSVSVTIPNASCTHSGKCQFLGWSTDKNATSKSYSAGSSVSSNGDLLLYAVYQSAHTDSNGDKVCDSCGRALQVPGQTGDVYRISTKAELIWFAEHVNAGNKNASAVLTADIDMGGYTWKPIASTLSYHVTAVTDKGYTGTFDGAGHVIKNFKVVCESGDGSSGASGNVKSYGLFGTVSGTVKNVGIDGFTFTGDQDGMADCRAGGVVGQLLSGGRIENCYTVNSNILTDGRIAGGIAGCSYGGTIANCFAYNNTVTGHSRCAAIVGDTVTDSGAPAKLVGTVTNCYADKNPVGSQNGGSSYVKNCATLSASQISSGEAAYKLNGGNPSGLWKQTVGSGVPSFIGKNVYAKFGCDGKTATGYSNTEGLFGGHVGSFDSNGFCTNGCYQPATGRGTESDPYKIGNAGQLYWFAAEVNGGDTDAWAELTANITVNNNVLKEDGTLNGDGSGFLLWTPIGDNHNSSSRYTGTFNGNGKTVSGLYVNGNTSNVGLIGYLKGTVKNVGVVDSYLSGSLYVGGVVGDHYSGTVKNCYNTGSVSGSKYVGGVVGYNNSGTVTGCYNEGTVNGSDEYAGGVAGDNISGTVESCYNTGSVSGSKYVGGVASYNTGNGTVEDCYNTGNVSGSQHVGGLVGRNYNGPVVNSHNIGSVSGSRYVGGLVGENYDYGIVVNSHNIGSVSGSSYVGGLVGGNNDQGTVVNCYYDSDIHIGTGIGVNFGTATDVLGKPTAEFASGAVTYSLSQGCTVGKTVYSGDVWGQNIDGTGDKDAYPVFSDAKIYQAKNCKGEISGYSNTDGKQLDHTYNDNGFCTVCGGFQSATGSGTESNPYQIGNAGQLYWFAAEVNDGHTDAWAELTANIVVNENVLKADGTLNGDGSNFRPWTPISPKRDNMYTGTFDGKEYTVSGLYFKKNTSYVGLFGYVGMDGTVKNVGVVDSYLSGGSDVGGVVGKNDGTVEDCYNTGTVSGIEISVGGVVGYSFGNVVNCYNTGNVSGSDSVGGVVGTGGYGSTVENCYNTGNVSGRDYVGGLVGYSSYCTVANCYNAGNLSGSSNVGGVVGRSNNDSVVNSYNSGTVSGSNDYVGGVVGYSNPYGTVEDCYNSGTVSGSGNNVGGVMGYNSCPVANCYYDSTVYSGNAIGSGNGTATNVEGKTTEQFKSGEVAYLLQGEQTQQVWGQNIDGEGEKDAYPVFSYAKVYPAKNCDGSDGAYSNTQDVQKDHIYNDNGFCTFCKGYQPATGDGTQDNPYKIGNAGQLYWFAAVVNDGYGGVAKDLSACAELAADITVNENVLTEDGTLNDDVSVFLSWTPIGETSDDKYVGTFDGKEYTVSGLYFNENINYVGLFGYVGMDGTVKNVGVVDSYLSGYEAVGGVVGQNDKGTITGCYNEGTVSGSGSNVGGVVGTSRYNSTVENCYNTGRVSGYRCVGGVVGSNYGTVESCHNTGIVSGDDGYVSDSGNNIGGVVGANLGGTITGCYNEGSVSGSGNNVGGVAGYIIGSVKNCYNTGNVSGKEYVGGVVGQNNGGVLSSYNSGDVSGEEYVGGVVGQNNSGVLNSYNSGSVGGSGSYIGGVVGENSAGVSVMNCYYDSTVYSGNAIGADEGTATNVEGKTTEQFKSGEVAYLLQGEQTQQVWGQNIDGEGEKDVYPLFSDAKVYPAKNCDGSDGAYSNTQDVQKDHIYSDNGFCTFCDGFQSATGSGTESNPYKIGNAGQLYWFAAEVNDGYTDAWAVLTANITVNTGDVAGCNGTKAEGWKEWTPIGKDYDTQYTGTFDGKGFTVSGLYFNKSDTNYVGLFGYSGGTVKNVGVVNSYLHGNERVSGVVGYNDYGNMEDCYNTGTVIGIHEVGGVTSCNIYGTVTNCYNEGAVSGSYSYVGGVAGYNYGGTVTNCYNEGTVSISGDYVGGVAGYNYKGTVTNCYNEGSVSGSNWYVGGVAGSNDYGTVTNCYNEGSVSGSIFTGGVVGSNYGPVVNSYNIGSVSGSTYTGGVVGENYGPVVNCYNIGSVSGDSFTGGVVGNNSGPVVNCYYDSTVYTGNAIGSDKGTSTNVLGKTTAEFASGAVTYSLSQGCTVGEGETAVTYPGDVWGQNIDGEGEKDASPVFSDAKVYAAKNCANVIAGYSNTDGKQLDHTYNNNGFCTVCKGYQPATGSGIESDPYKIGNAGQLYWFAAAVNDGDPDAWAELTANIVVNENVLKEDGTLSDDSGDFQVWKPIGKDAKNMYTGTFDGKEFTVSGLYSANSSIDNVGLFGWSKGTVKNVGVKDSYLSGGYYVGSVVGYNSGTVKGCYNTGGVSGSGNNVGGVVGGNSGTVESCYNTGSVSGSNYVGGVVGINSGTVEICYNSGTVSGSYYAGGVVGYNSGTVANCYHTGAVNGSRSVGGVVGINNGGTVLNSYNTGSVSGSQYVGGVVGSNSGTVEICYNSGSVIGDYYVGGVAGINNSGTVLNSYNTGSVSGSNDVGGVVGENRATVESCYNTGSVSSDYYVGGVVGSNDNGTVEICYNSGSVIGTITIGGVVGYNNEGTVVNSHNIGSVSGSNYVGGVVGNNYEGTVVNSYSSGSVSGSHAVGGVVGDNIGTVVNCYYDSTVYNGNAIGSEEGTSTNVLGKTTAEFASGAVTYSLSQGCTLGEGETAVTYPGDVWGQNIDGEGKKDAYPVFSDAKVYFGFTDCGDETPDYTNGTVTEARPQHSQDLVYADLGDGTHSISCSACGQAVREPEAHSFTDYQQKPAEPGLGEREEAACDQDCGAVHIRSEVPGTALVVRNVRTGQLYTGLDAALKEIQEGDTLQLEADVTWSGLLWAVNLDLNGFVLSVDRSLVVFDDANILDNSASNSGLLLLEEAAKEYLVLPECNQQLPIYGSRMGAGEDKRVGYSFVEVEKFNTAFLEDGTFAFQPVLERSACDLLQAGADVSQVQVVVRVSWTNDSGDKRSQDFVYNDDLVRKFAASYSEAKSAYGLMFTLKLNVENLEDFGFQILVVSNRRVQIGTEMLYK